MNRVHGALAVKVDVESDERDQHLMASGARLSREASYLFRLAGPNAGAQPSTGLSWAEVIRLADEEKAIPILFDHVKRQREALGAQEMRRLQQLTFAWASRMAHLQQRLEHLLARYREAGIRVILLKGAALASTVYPSFTRR